MVCSNKLDKISHADTWRLFYWRIYKVLMYLMKKVLKAILTSFLPWSRDYFYNLYYHIIQSFNLLIFRAQSFVINHLQLELFNKIIILYDKYKGPNLLRKVTLRRFTFLKRQIQDKSRKNKIEHDYQKIIETFFIVNHPIKKSPSYQTRHNKNEL